MAAGRRESSTGDSKVSATKEGKLRPQDVPPVSQADHVRDPSLLLPGGQGASGLGQGL